MSETNTTQTQISEIKHSPDALVFPLRSRSCHRKRTQTAKLLLLSLSTQKVSSRSSQSVCGASEEVDSTPTDRVDFPQRATSLMSAQKSGKDAQDWPMPWGKFPSMGCLEVTLFLKLIRNGYQAQKANFRLKHYSTIFWNAQYQPIHSVPVFSLCCEFIGSHTFHPAPQPMTIPVSSSTSVRHCSTVRASHLTQPPPPSPYSPPPPSPIQKLFGRERFAIDL